MGTYGETVRQATAPATSFQEGQQMERASSTCDQCVAPSVAVAVFGDGPSALSLHFCRHHLRQHSDKLADGGHQVTF
ncbi:hypothetical protein M3225_28895, partial [Priestia aryabhattai]|uniref:DUF7455 domain-containing protein n=1 Tax=Priestia aryabhattai TaxID=412384 RepID=UPI00203D6109